MMIKAALLAAVIAAGGVSGQVAELAEAAVYEKAESSVNEKDVQMCAKLVWGEARGCRSFFVLQRNYTGFSVQSQRFSDQYF